MSVSAENIRQWTAEALATDKEVFTTEEAARFAGVSTRTLWNWLPPRGDLPCYEIGGSRRFLRSDLLEFIKRHRVEGGVA